MSRRRTNSGAAIHVEPLQYAEIGSVIRMFRNEPGKFVRGVLGVKPTTQQAEALAAIAKPGAHVSIRSGHGTGKSALLSWIILWALTCFDDVKIPCTAPTAHQLYDVLWGELTKWHAKMLEPFQSLIQISMDRAWVVGKKETCYAVARTARAEQPEALQGFHASHLVFIIDEASGVPDKIFEAAEGSLSTPGARVVLVGNPTRTMGYFYDSHHSRRHSYVCLHWPSTESPLVSKDFVQTMAERYGTHSNIYRVRVLGEFPTAEPDQFIPLELLLMAVERDVEESGPIVWGLDPAYMGDDETVLAKRHGNVVKEVVGVRQFNTMQTVGWVVEQYMSTKAAERPEAIYVDVIGIGAGVYDRLRELGYPAIAVNVAESPSVSTRYANLRAELWGAFRDWLQDRMGKLPYDQDLLGQAASVKYSFDSQGRLRLETKAEMRRRGLPSPDRADAVVLTFAYRPAPRYQQTLKVINDWNVLEV